MTTAAEFFAVLGVDIDAASFAKGDAVLSKLGDAARSLSAAVAGAFAVDAIKDFTLQTIAAIPGIGDLADQTGFAAEEIQRLGFAASQSGADAGTLNTALLKLIGNLGNAAAGGEGVNEALRKLGVNTSGIAKQDPSKVLAQIADGLAGIESTAERAALAQTLFGLSGKQLVPFLSQGSAAIADLGAQADALGLVLGRDVIDQVGEVDDRIVALEATVGAVGRSLVVTALPAIESIVDGLAFLARVGVKGARVIRDNAAAFKVLGGVLAVIAAGSALVWLQTIAAFVAGNILVLASNSTLTASYGVLAGAIDVAALSAVRFLARAAAAAAPILAFAAAAAFLYLVLEDIYTGITGGESILIGFIGRFGELAEVFYAAAGDEGAGFFARAIAAVGLVVAGALAAVDAGIAAMLDNVGDLISFGGLIIDFVVSPLETTRDVVRQLVSDVSAGLATIANLAGRAVSSLSGPLSAVFGSDAVARTAASLQSVTASQAASAALSVPVVRAAVGGATNQTVTVGAPTITLNVDGGGDPAVIGAAAADAVSAAIERSARAAAVDLLPNGG